MAISVRSFALSGSPSAPLARTRPAVRPTGDRRPLATDREAGPAAAQQAAVGRAPGSGLDAVADAAATGPAAGRWSARDSGARGERADRPGDGGSISGRPPRSAGRGLAVRRRGRRPTGSDDRSLGRRRRAPGQRIRRPQPRRARRSRASTARRRRCPRSGCGGRPAARPRRRASGRRARAGWPSGRGGGSSR